MHFAHPTYLWLIPVVIIPLVVWYIMKQHNARPSMSISTITPFMAVRQSWRAYVRHLLFVLRLCVIALLMMILARPQLRDTWRTTNVEGTDIVIALDVSSSMLARDFDPDRLEAAKKIASDFIRGRKGDNIGVVIFAGESLTGIPMTVDHAALLNYVNSIKMNLLPDGTAIGDGIATSINRLKEGKAKSKSIILITDGSNNTGVVAPLSAASAAKEYDIKVYAIGVGTTGMAPMPVIGRFNQIEYEMQKVDFDEATLRQIATLTDGQYFRATDNNSLSEIFSVIDQLEKTRMDVTHFSHTEDDYMPFAWLAFALLCLELLLRYTVTRSIP